MGLVPSLGIKNYMIPLLQCVKHSPIEKRFYEKVSTTHISIISPPPPIFHQTWRFLTYAPQMKDGSKITYWLSFTTVQKTLDGQYINLEIPNGTNYFLKIPTFFSSSKHLHGPNPIGIKNCIWSKSTFISLLLNIDAHVCIYVLICTVHGLHFSDFKCHSL